MMIKKGETTIAHNVKRASGFFERSLGLMFSSGMHGLDGLLLEPCKSIHTFFMKYPIDVVFLDRQMNIVAIVRNMRPWRVSRIYFKAVYTLELGGGALPDSINVGDSLEVVCTS